MSEISCKNENYRDLAGQIKRWAQDLGFAEARITRAELPPEAEQQLATWLAAAYHGEMDYMARHGALRVRPAELVPGTLRVISLRMHYWPESAADAEQVLTRPQQAYISRYALGRDYHKVLRNRLQKLAEQISAAVPAHQFRVFTDSAPLAEVALAAQAGQGWRGKHTLLLNKKQGSLFFLGEILTNLPLPEDEAEDGHCGRCTRCIDACPTGAIVAPYTVDARRCISYLTIELKGAIPEPMRPLIGNRIYGCDDCQLVCPWNRFVVPSREADFAVRHGLDDVSLLALFAWHEQDFQQRMAGSPIYRIGYAKWLSNIAIALGNAPYSAEVVHALQGRADDAADIVRESVAWALQQQQQKA